MSTQLFPGQPRGSPFFCAHELNVSLAFVRVVAVLVWQFGAALDMGESGRVGVGSQAGGRTGDLLIYPSGRQYDTGSLLESDVVMKR